MSRVLLFLLPVLIGIFSERKKNYKSLNKWILILLSSIILFIILYVLGKYKSPFDIYKKFLLSTIVSILEYYAVIPIIRNKKLSSVNVLYIICTFSVVSTIYYILTHGQARIDSDVAMTSNLARVIWETKSLFPKNWAYANGDIWVISIHTFVLPFIILLKNQSLIRMLAASLLILTTILGIYYQDKKIFKNRSWLISIPLFLLFLHGKESLRFIRFDNLYTIQMLFITIILTQITLIYKKNINNKKIILFLILNLVLTITGLRILSYFTLPLFMTFLYLFYFEVKDVKNIRKETFYNFFRIFLIILVPALIGSCFHLYLRKSHIVDGVYRDVSRLMYVSNIEEIRKNLILYFEYLFQTFGFAGKVELLTIRGIQNLISIVSYFMIIFYIPILQFKKLRNENKEVVIFYTFGIFHSLIIFIVIVFLGKIEMITYVYTTIYICILISSRYVMDYWFNERVIRRFVFVLIFSITCIFQIASDFLSTKGWKQELSKQKEFTHELINKNLIKGYSNYWNAYNNNLYSDYKLRISAINIDKNNGSISPFRWQTDINQFNSEKNLKTFLLLTKEENEIIKPTLEALFGKPIDSFVFKDVYSYIINTDEFIHINMIKNDMYVYVFDHDIVTEFPNGLEDNRLFPSELRWKENVTFENKEAVISPGGYIYGPYAEISEGNYTLTIYGTNLDKASIDVFSQISSEQIFYSINNISSNKVELKLDIKEKVSQIEFRVFNNTKTDIIKLKYMEIN